MCHTVYLLLSHTLAQIASANALIAVPATDANVDGDCLEDRLHRRNSGGYPYIHAAGKSQSVARVVLSECGAPPSPRHHCHHRCRNKVCVNPNHLEWRSPGSHQRMHLIEAGVWMVPDHEVKRIRYEAENELRPQQDIANEYGVSQPFVSRVKNGRIRRVA
jgi:hypothetical protein